MPAAGSGDVLGDLSERPVIPCVFRASRVRPAKGSRVVAWLEDRDTNTAYSRFLGPARDPAILLNARGNALYVSADVDATYHINRGAVGGELIRRLVRRFLGQDCCLCTNAPESVEITVRRQVAQGRTVIHLVNATSAAIRPIEDLVPVRDITVSLPAERPGRVFSLRGRPVHWTCRGGMLRVCLDRLDLYDLIVIETQ
jgi:hypothetical protein